jgi:hypothetical protein
MMLTNLIQAIAGCCKTVHSSLINVMLGILFDKKVSLIGYSSPLLSGEKWIGKSSVQSVEICDKLLVFSERDCLPFEQGKLHGQCYSIAATDARFPTG